MRQDSTRDSVRQRYAELATAAAQGASCCTSDEQTVFGASRYQADDLEMLPETAAAASIGCGNPTAMADLSEGETVLDLGSGGGIDVILSARRVGPTGKAYGLDMTDEMLDLARRNATEAGITNVEFLKGHIEQIPLPDASVDVVISNCVINLSTDKAAVISEAARVLRPGGRFAVSDVIADADMDDTARQPLDQWSGCVTGALTRVDYTDLLERAGLTGIEIIYSHRVHTHASSAIIRACKPSLPTRWPPSTSRPVPPAGCAAVGLDIEGGIGEEIGVGKARLAVTWCPSTAAEEGPCPTAQRTGAPPRRSRRPSPM